MLQAYYDVTRNGRRAGRTHGPLTQRAPGIESATARGERYADGTGRNTARLSAGLLVLARELDPPAYGA